jgi:hypothetical protein
VGLERPVDAGFVAVLCCLHEAAGGSDRALVGNSANRRYLKA